MKADNISYSGVVACFIASFILLASLLVLPSVQGAVGDAFTLEGLKYTVLTEEPASQTGTVSVEAESKNISGDIVIPPSVIHGQFNYSITLLSAIAFRDCKSLRSIIIPDSVTSIGYWAFFGCSSLTDVTLGNGVTEIGYRAFYKCSALTSVAIPDSVTSLGDATFEGCSALTSATIGNGVTSIAASAFLGCSSLKNIIIPDGVTTIRASAFQECSSLTSIIFPDSVAGIFGQAFYNCTSLTNITIGKGEISISEYAFQGCSSLISLIIPDNVASIAYRGFYDCSSLTNLTIGCRYIGGEAFAHCSSLASVTIGNSVTSISQYAFQDCSNLTTAYFKGDAPEVGKGVFTSDPLLYYLAGASGWTTPTWNGYRTAIWAPEEPPALSYEMNADKLVITYSGGSLEASSDLILWNRVEVTQEGKYEVNLPSTGKMFFRIAQ